MECSNCGAINDDDATFCHNCGAALGYQADPLAEEAMVVSSPDDALYRSASQLASIWRRLFARIIDGVIVGAVIVVLLFAFGGGITDDSTSTGTGFGFFLLGFVITAAYEVGMVSSRGQTIGKIWLGIKVVRAEDDDLHPPIGRAAIRWVLPNVVSLFGFIGSLLTLLIYLSAAWDGQKQGWHDKAARTLVIKI